VHAAGGANFAPGGIAVFIFGIKVGIAKVGGGTLLLFNFVFVGDGVLDGDFGFFGLSKRTQRETRQQRREKTRRVKNIGAVVSLRKASNPAVNVPFWIVIKVSVD